MDEALRLAAALPAMPLIISGAAGEFLIQVLSKDAARGLVTTIVHLPAGESTPARRHHAGSELPYVLESGLDDAGQTYDPGNFLTHAAGHGHPSHSSREGARVVAVQVCQSHGGAFDFELA